MERCIKASLGLYLGTYITTNVKHTSHICTITLLISRLCFILFIHAFIHIIFVGLFSLYSIRQLCRETGEGERDGERPEAKGHGLVQRAHVILVQPTRRFFNQKKTQALLQSRKLQCLLLTGIYCFAAQN